MTRTDPTPRALPNAARPAPARHPIVRRAATLAVAAGLVTGTALWARHIDAYLGDAAPLLGHLQPRVSWLIIPALAVAVAAAWAAPGLAQRLPWRWLPTATWLAALCWAFALAGADGSAGILQPLSTPDEYLPDLAHVHGLAAYISGFTAHVHDPPAGQFLWSVHVSGGPPGPLLIFALLARAGLRGPVPAALLVVFAGAAAAPAAAVTARHLAGEAAARRTAPFLAFAPLAIWVATSADALFLGLSAWGIALLAIAATTPATDRRRADLLALLAGLLLGVALYCSYGITPLGAVAVAVALAARRLRPLIPATVGVLAVAAGFAGYGFWWWTGLDATRVRYAEGIASLRPYDYFLLADLAALAIAIGPAAIAGLGCLPRNSRLWWPIGAALIAAASADLSGLSKGEVERIWLPFAIWLLLATAALPPTRDSRGWLVAQIAFGLTLQVVLVTNW